MLYHFRVQGQTFWSFLQIRSLIFAEMVHGGRHYRMSKNDWILNEPNILALKNAEKQNSTKSILQIFQKCYLITVIQKEVKVTFSFFRGTLIMPKKPGFGRFRVQNWNVPQYFLFHYFNVAFIFTWLSFEKSYVYSTKLWGCFFTRFLSSG